MPKTVRDIIKDRKEVYCISNQTTVAEAARYLKDRAIRAAGVCNLSGKIVGVASQGDVMRCVMGGAAPWSQPAASARELDVQRVGGVMGPVGPTVLPDDPVSSLVRMFVRERVQRALVVEHGMLLGIVTPVDVLGSIDETAGSPHLDGESA